RWPPRHDRHRRARRLPREPHHCRRYVADHRSGRVVVDRCRDRAVVVRRRAAPAHRVTVGFALAGRRWPVRAKPSRGPATRPADVRPHDPARLRAVEPRTVACECDHGGAMLAMQVGRSGGPEVLETVEMPRPQPRTGEVLVRLAAAGVNYIDVYLRSGRYPADVPFVP